MKSIPIALTAALLLAVPIPGAVLLARADGPIEVTAPAGDDPPSQVLEIPQACAQDGGEDQCPNADLQASADGSAAAPYADGSAASGDANGADGGASLADSNVGNAQDYQDQREVGGGLLVSSAAPFGSVASSEPFLRMPTIMVAPVPIRPFVGAAPYVPRVLAPAGPITLARPAWMFPPRPMTPMIMTRPIGPAGMPRAFRVR